jgi:hypothetical protein
MRIVSLALFADPAGKEKRDYAKHLPAAIRAHHAWYAGWTLRIHATERALEIPYGPALRDLERRGLLELVVSAPPRTPAEGKLWRLQPLWDERTRIVAPRDLDAIATPRERAVVDAWEASGEIACVIHDHPQHNGLMGGTTAYRSSDMRGLLGAMDLRGLVSAGRQAVAKRGRMYGSHDDWSDQNVLNYCVRPLLPRLTVFAIEPDDAADAKRRIHDEPTWTWNAVADWGASPDGTLPPGSPLVRAMNDLAPCIGAVRGSEAPRMLYDLARDQMPWCRDVLAEIAAVEAETWRR